MHTTRQLDSYEETRFFMHHALTSLRKRLFVAQIYIITELWRHNHLGAIDLLLSFNYIAHGYGEQTMRAILSTCVISLCSVWFSVLWPFLLTLTLIPALISENIFSKMWDEITCPFPNFNDATVDVLECISNFIPHFIMAVIAYPCGD